VRRGRPRRSGILGAAAALVLALLAPAAGGAGAFRFERDVVPGGPGPNRLEVDLPLLAGALPFDPAAGNGLADLRLLAASGEEVPYLLIEPPRVADVWDEARTLAIAPTKTSSGFEADLGRTVLSDRLDLGGLGAPFLKRARLEGSGDRARWTVLADEVTVFDLPAERLTRTWVDFPPSEVRYLRLTWNDASSARLELPGRASARRVVGAPPAPPLAASLPFERRGAEPGRSRYRVRLPAARLPVVAFEFVVGEANVARDVRITEARLRGSELVPVTLGSSGLRRAARGALSAGDLVVPVERPSEASVEIEVDDGSNPPLELREIRAVFGRLPWIYFESRAGEKLTARFGAPGLAAPRYDLEAARGSAEGRPLLRAAWGERRDAAPTPGGPSAPVVPGGGPIDPKPFRSARTIPAGPAGLTALKLDAAVLAGSDGLSDVRIATPGGAQVPYLLETLSEPLTLKLPALRSIPRPEERGRTAAADPRRSYFEAILPYHDLPPARLSIPTGARVFHRLVALLFLRDETVPSGRSDRPDGWKTVAGATWTHADPESPAPPLSLEVPKLPQGRLVLAIDDGDNGPLPLGEPLLFLPSHRLRFVREGTSPLTLLYGQPGLAAPRYDIALLASRLLGAPAEEVSPDPAEEARSPERPAWTGRLFWGALIGAVVVLLGLVVRLLGRSEEPPAG
jgi:hypothetical protein